MPNQIKSNQIKSDLALYPDVSSNRTLTFFDPKYPPAYIFPIIRHKHTTLYEPDPSHALKR